ncbi:MAG TPA: NAD-dependent epimerase/dehydratase family protein [Candidatus Ruania gallistercoris]|uniref:NAD-dependent epimerase/dehydratase family protein n=1 Tax=Candidatus Ruania gallistercoris TaxID=2838746 RepID=A0A9D2EC15_9MICO|nr:NAD-dependent epimerase/dehydratase family protein [Candidatus Ruania gallistercoris]
MSTTYLVTGAGPVGATIATQLAERGDQVRLATRSGSGPEHDRIERIRLDVNNATELERAIQGVRAVFHAIHGSRYRAAAWRAELPGAEQTVMNAAAAAGAVVVFPESLYSYGPVDSPMAEGTPSAATTGKLGVRTELLRARREHAADTVSMVASDFYGPRVRTAMAGERMVTRLLAGQSVQVIGRLDQPHSFTYVPDLAAAMIAAADQPQAWNRVLHAPTAPPVTQRELVRISAEVAGMRVPRILTVPVGVLRVLGVFGGMLREVAETAYMWDGPFVMTSTVTEELLDLQPTPLRDGLAATVDYWREGRPVRSAV